MQGTTPPKEERELKTGTHSGMECKVSKAKFQNRGKLPIFQTEVACTPSDLHVVMDTKAWDPRDQEQELMAALRIGFLSRLG